jgi:hypothetical protein
MFESIGVATVALADKTATADQSYRLFGQRMYMSMQNAKSLKIALDSLGQPLDAIAFDPELHRRFDELANLQNRLAPMLGPDFKSTMVQLRDAQFEFTRFRVEAMYFRDLLVKQVFQALGGETLTAKLRSWNDYIIQHIPEWSRVIKTYLVPVLKDAWMILKDVWRVGTDFAQIFTNLIGIFSGDPALQGRVSFEKFGAALEKVAHWLAVIVHYASNFAGMIGGAALGGAAGSAIGLLTGGPAGMVAGGAMGTLIGAGVGGAADLIRSTFHDDAGGMAGIGTAPAGIATIAGQVGQRLNVDPSIIYAQWAHETGGFTNRGATSLNNLAGIRMPGSTDYRSFGSLGEFGNYYANLIQRRYPQALGAQSIDQYATALKAGGYFEDSLANYERGMHRYAGAISIGQINIMQPNATPDQITQAFSDAIAKREQAQSAIYLNELKPAY